MNVRATERGRKIKCLDVAKHVQLELDHALTQAACRQIRAHLRKCPNCTAYLDSLKKAVLLYQLVPSPHVSKKARERLFAVLRLHLKAH